MNKRILKIFVIVFILFIGSFWINTKKNYAVTDEVYGPFEHSIIGARVWSTYNGNLNMREKPTSYAKLIVGLPQGQKMQIIGDIINNYVKVKTEYDGTVRVGYVHTKYLMINLPDIMPSLEYYISNADYCWYTCERYGIPDVTGEVLYPNVKYTIRPIGYNTYTRFDPDTGKTYTFNKYYVTEDVTKYYVPLKYDAAVKLSKAYDQAKNEGYNFKIYDAYRPYSVTKDVYDKFYKVAYANDERGANMRAAMSGEGLNISWFLASVVSSHNRGIALDLTLTKDGKEIDAQSKMHQLDASSAVSKNNKETNRLRDYMVNAGFSTLKSEWWHFQDNDASGDHCSFQIK